MVSPVRIRVPPLKKVLQIAEKTGPRQCYRSPLSEACQQLDRENVSSRAAGRSLACLLWGGCRWRGSSCYGSDLDRRCLGGVMAEGFAGLEWERLWMEQYGALVAATPKYDPPSVVEGRSALGLRQAPDRRGGDLSTQEFLLFGTPPRQEFGRAVDALSGQGRGLHLRLNGSTTPSADRCATWRSCPYSSLHIMLPARNARGF
jgi:hypothetical protein